MSLISSEYSIITEWNKNKRIYKDIHGFGYPFYHIHPYKQKTVKHIIDNLHPSINYVIVFGSSVHPWHKWWKDLDLCVIGKLTDDVISESQPKLYCKGVSIDFLYYQTLDNLYEDSCRTGSVRYYIKNEGVMVYEKI